MAGVKSCPPNPGTELAELDQQLMASDLLHDLPVSPPNTTKMTVLQLNPSSLPASPQEISPEDSQIHSHGGKQGALEKAACQARHEEEVSGEFKQSVKYRLSPHCRNMATILHRSGFEYEMSLQAHILNTCSPAAGAISRG